MPDPTTQAQALEALAELEGMLQFDWPVVEKAGRLSTILRQHLTESAATIERLREHGPEMQRGTCGDGTPWMGTMLDVLNDYKLAASVEADLRREFAAEAERLRGEVEGLRKWHPMETAPKDGTNVLLVNRRGNIASGLWQEGLNGRYTGWYLRGNSSGQPDTFFNHHHGPTHWKPWPDLPEPSDG